MSNVAALTAGAEAFAATSHDSEHPVSNVIDGDPGTFWSSTGLFPQEFVIRLSAKSSASRLKIVSTGIKRILVERSDGASPVNWQPYIETELPDVEGRQVSSLTTPGFPVVYLKVKIISAYTDFVTIRAIEVTA